MLFDNLKDAFIEVKKEIRPMILSRNFKQKHVVIFDIDDTLLFMETKYEVTKSGIQTMADYSSAKRNEPIYEFYKWVAAFPNVHIVFVTGRVDDNDTRTATMKQLLDLGYTRYEHLYLMPKAFMAPLIAQAAAAKQKTTNAHPSSEWLEAVGKAISRFKFTQRSFLAMSEHILFNVGDQWQDVVLGGTFGPHGTLSAKQIYLLRFPKPEPAFLSLKLPSRL